MLSDNQRLFGFMLQPFRDAGIPSLNIMWLCPISHIFYLQSLLDNCKSLTIRLEKREMVIARGSSAIQLYLCWTPNCTLFLLYSCCNFFALAKPYFVFIVHLFMIPFLWKCPKKCKKVPFKDYDLIKTIYYILSCRKSIPFSRHQLIKKAGAHTLFFQNCCFNFFPENLPHIFVQL